jgi:O-antigen/teichoic acid export membrane protein
MAGKPAGQATASHVQVRGSSLLLAGQVFGTTVNLVTQILIVRALSKTEFGAFGFALSVLVVAEIVNAFGLRSGIARVLPQYEERGDLARSAGTLALAFGVVVILGFVVVGGVVGASGAIAGGLPPAAQGPALLSILILLAPIQALGSLLDNIYAVFGLPRTIVLRRNVLAPLLRLAVVGALILVSGDVILLAAGYVITGALGLVIFGASLVPLLSRRSIWAYLRPGRIKVPARRLLSTSVPLLANDLRTGLLVAAGGLLLGLLSTPAEVAEFRAVLPIAIAMLYVRLSFGLLFTPMASRMLERGETGALSSLYWQATAWTTVLSYPVLLVAAGLAEPLTVLLFGARYAAAAPVLAILALASFITTATGPNSEVLVVFGRLRLVLVTNVAIAILALVLTVALIPPLGAVGAAWATTLAQVVMVVVWQAGLAWRTSVRALDARYLRVHAAVAGVTAAYAAALWLTGPPLSVRIALTVLACLAVVWLSRRLLVVAETFPELRRVPLLGRLAGGRGD